MEKKDIIKHNNIIIKKFTEEYSINNVPIPVSFREILPDIKIDRYTHLIHTYPAKLLVHIPYFFLNNTIFSKEGNYVLDPFNGSGTVLLESILAKRNAFGADSNPLARLISEVKVSDLDTDQLSIISKKIIRNAKKYKKFKIPDIVNCDFWFHKNIKLQLGQLLASIKKIKDENIRKFFLVSFSNCVKKVSYADQRISVPVKLNPNRYPKGSIENTIINNRLKELQNYDVFEKFSSIANENINRYRSFEECKISKYNAKIISDDARKLTTEIGKKKLLKDKSIHLIITSPPYAGAQKYIRASSLSLGWSELATASELLILDKKNIGRENYIKSEIIISKTGIKKADKLIAEIYKINRIRGKIVCNYLIEMQEALIEMCRVLKKGGYLVLVVGNNKVCDREFNTQEYFTDFLIQNNLTLQFKLIDDIKSYGLMTKRNKTADIISREWILVFKKK